MRMELYTEWATKGSKWRMQILGQKREFHVPGKLVELFIGEKPDEDQVYVVDIAQEDVKWRRKTRYE